MPSVEAGKGDKSLPLQTLIIAGWLIGVSILLARLTFHQAMLAQMLCHCEPVMGNDWASSFADAAQRLRVTRPVRLVKHTEALTPATGGIWRPTVILPVDARGWTVSQRRSVLLHELAHVKRCDVFTQFVARIACAIHWYNPLAWYGLARCERCAKWLATTLSSPRAKRRPTRPKCSFKWPAIISPASSQARPAWLAIQTSNDGFLRSLIRREIDSH
jgi:hypothetical protein